MPSRRSEKSNSGYQPIGPDIDPRMVFAPGQNASASVMPGRITVSDHTTPMIADDAMYIAFAAEHLGMAIRCLSLALDAQPVTLAYLRDTLADWQQQRTMLEAEVKS